MCLPEKPNSPSQGKSRRFHPGESEEDLGEATYFGVPYSQKFLFSTGSDKTRDPNARVQRWPGTYEKTRASWSANWSIDESSNAEQEPCQIRKLGQRARLGSPRPEVSQFRDCSPDSSIAGMPSSPRVFTESREHQKALRRGLAESPERFWQNEDSVNIQGEWLQRELGCKVKSPSRCQNSISSREIVSLGQRRRRVEGPWAGNCDTVGLAVPGLSPQGRLPRRGLGSALPIQSKHVGEFSSGPSPASTLISNKKEQSLRYERPKSMPPPPRRSQPDLLCPEGTSSSPSRRTREFSQSRRMQ